MSHITGTVQTLASPINLGPDFGLPTIPPDTWVHNFANTPPPIGVTKLVILHFRNVSLPGNNRLEVDLGYGTDVFTSADGPEFWTRPANVYVLPGGLVPIRYIRDGAPNGGVQLDRYGRGEQHEGERGHPSISNCDPFLENPSYAEPAYDSYWFCGPSPIWENAVCAPAGDVRARVARSVGMIVSVEGSVFTGTEQVSTCSVTLVDADKIITAGHCHRAAEALNSSITFDYQTDCAGNRVIGYDAKFYKVKAVIRHRYDGGGDYSLLQLKEAPPGIPAIQMRHDLPAVNEEVFGVHHPNGAIKKLSIPHPNFERVISSDAASIRVNLDISGGSSGSGLFDTAGRITGVLSSSAACSLGYFPTSSILADLTPAPPTPITRDVMVVFDRSGSMSEGDGTGRTKIEAARDALSLFIKLVRSGVGNRLGLVSFSTAASSPIDFGIDAVTEPNQTTLIGLAPFTGGLVGALRPDGATSIGDGLDNARLQFPAPGANPRAILLMTDGMENSIPLITTVAGSLTGIDIHAIGFGTDANLNGPLLNDLAMTHSGFYTRAESGLTLEKFFSHAFGNIFEAGVLFDPEYDLPADQSAGKTEQFFVCGEDGVTVIVGWDQPDATLLLELKSPGGVTITAASPGVEHATGRTWTFLRIPLPHGGERDGVWSITPSRPDSGNEFPPPAPRLRYFINVIPSGGPKLLRWPDSRSYYTGDLINPLVLIRYADGSWPENASVAVTLTRPATGAGNILSKEKMRTPVTISGDTIPARQATLAALERETRQAVIVYTEETFDLADDSASTSTLEPAAVFGKPLNDRLVMEGNYNFHFRATYGEGCTATRELIWSVHVDVSIDPSQTIVTTTDTGTRPDGKHNVIITLTPRDRYGNNLGPGRGDGISVSGTPGTTVTGPPNDNGDGSYSVPGAWDPASGQPPGVVVGQPGRPGVVVQEPAAKEDCRKWKMLFWLLLLLLLILLVLLLLCWFK